MDHLPILRMRQTDGILCLGMSTLGRFQVPPVRSPLLDRIVRMIGGELLRQPEGGLAVPGASSLVQPVSGQAGIAQGSGLSGREEILR